MSQAREHESHAGAKGLQEKHSSAHGTYAAGQRDAEVAGSMFEPCMAVQAQTPCMQKTATRQLYTAVHRYLVRAA
jgi:hypothetical protein